MEATDNTAKNITREESPERKRAMPNFSGVVGSLFRRRRKVKRATSRGVRVTIKNGPIDWNSSALASLTLLPGGGQFSPGILWKYGSGPRVLITSPWASRT